MLIDLGYLPNTPDTVGWKARHKAALLCHPVATAIRAWVDYAKAHERRFGSGIGDDYVLGPAWRDWGKALRTLLNGETGGLDCGTLDHILVHNLTDQGFAEDTL